MGNTFVKCKNFISMTRRKDIISLKALRSVCEVVEFLKLYSGNRNIFLETGYQRRVRQIAACMSLGSPGLLAALLGSSPVEAAAALQHVLVRLSHPLLPRYVQDLARHTDSQDVRPEVVAADMLGLLRQDLPHKHKLLVTVLFDLLYHLKKHARSDELVGSHVPMTLLPVFFNLQTCNTKECRHIANIFMEMVDLSPSALPLPRRYWLQFSAHFHDARTPSNQLLATTENQPRYHPPMFLDQEQQEMLQRRDVILHQVLVRTGSEGDANFAEIVDLNQLRRENRPNMKNPTFGYYQKRFL